MYTETIYEFIHGIVYVNGSENTKKYIKLNVLNKLFRLICIRFVILLF